MLFHGWPCNRIHCRLTKTNLKKGQNYRGETRASLLNMLTSTYHNFPSISSPIPFSPPFRVPTQLTSITVPQGFSVTARLYHIPSTILFRLHCCQLPSLHSLAPHSFSTSHLYHISSKVLYPSSSLQYPVYNTPFLLHCCSKALYYPLQYWNAFSYSAYDLSLFYSFRNSCGD